VRELICAPHRVKLLPDLAALEVTDRTVIDDAPVLLHTLRNLTPKVWEVLRPPDGDVQRSRGVECVTPIGGAKAVAKAHGVVAALGSDDHADLFAPPIADILIDGVVRRIAHDVVYVGLCFKESQELLIENRISHTYPSNDKLIAISIRYLSYFAI